MADLNRISETDYVYRVDGIYHIIAKVGSKTEEVFLYTVYNIST